MSYRCVATNPAGAGERPALSPYLPRFPDKRSLLNRASADAYGANVFEDFLDSIAKARGRYPVANLVGDFLKTWPRTRAFRLGVWLASLDLATLEDVQTKLDMFLGAEGPDHAGEDLLIAVDLLSCAEAGEPIELTDQDMKLRLLAWFEAGLLEKLSRHGLAKLHAPASIDPASRVQVSVSEELKQQLADQAPASTLPTTDEFLKR